VEKFKEGAVSLFVAGQEGLQILMYKNFYTSGVLFEEVVAAQV